MQDKSFLPADGEVTPDQVAELDAENKKVLEHLAEAGGLGLSNKLVSIAALGSWTQDDRELVMACVRWMARQVFINTWRKRMRERGSRKR